MGMLELHGVLYVALCAATGYPAREQDLSRRSRINAILGENHRAREQYASLQAQRLSLMRTYVARGLTMYADGFRMDALFVHETLQQAPYLDDLGDDPTLLRPAWLRDAIRELRGEDAMGGRDAAATPQSGSRRQGQS